MITTVTLNAAMDRALVVPNFAHGRKHRSSSGITLPGGHGVTIARALRRLGDPVITTGMVGGLTGANIVERLTDEGLLNDFVRIAEPSRTSTAVIDPVTGDHTEINENGPRVRREEVDLLIAKLRYLVRASRCVILAGTLPRDVDTDLYQRIIRTVGAPDVTTVVTQPDDTEVLRAAVSAEPSLVIIDQREAESLVGHEFTTDEDFLLGLDEMARMGASRAAVIVTDLGCFARVRDRRDVTYASATHEPVESVSELGSTDVFVAGYIHAMLAERPLEERLATGLGAALANRRALGAGVFDRGDAIRLQREVVTATLDPVPIEIDVD